MARLWNITTNQLEDIENPEEGFLSGSFGLKPDESANLVSSDNRVFKVPADKVAEHLQSGFRFEREDETLFRKIKNDPDNQGIIAGAKKFVKEALDEGLTLGLSEAYLDAYQDPKSPEAIRRRAEEESHPIANIAGGLTGGALSLVYGGPILKGIGWAGSKVAQGTLKAAEVLGTSAAAKAAGKVLAKGGQFAIEGALGVAPRAFGEATGKIRRARRELTEEQLGDSEVVAEALIGATEDLMLGAAGGAVLGLGAKAAGSLASKTLGFVGERVTKEQLNRWADIAWAKSRGFTTKGERGAVTRSAQISKLGTFEDAVEVLDQYKFEATGLFGEGARRNLDRADRIRRGLGNALGRLYRYADDKLGEAVPLGSFIRKLDDELAKIEARGGIDTPDYRALKAKQDVIFNTIRAREGKPSLTTEQMRAMGDRARVNFTTASEMKKSMSQLGKEGLQYDQNTAGHILGKTLWREHIEDSLEAAVSNLKKAQKFNSLLRKVNSHYGFFKNLLGKSANQNVFGNIVDRLEGNNFISLRDTVFASAGAVAGGVPGSLGTIAASQAMRKYGPELSARMLYGIAQNVDNVQARIYGAVDLAMGLAAKVKARPTTKAIVPLSANLIQKVTGEEDRQTAYRKLAKDLHRFSTDANSATNALSEVSSSISPYAPQISNQLSAKVAGGLSYLAQELPKGQAAVNALNPNPYVPTDRELAQFERKLQVVMDPLSVLDELSQGTVTREQMETLRVVYPRLYEVVQRRLIEQTAKLSGKLPYSKRVQLSQMLEMPTPANDAKRVQALQNNFISKPIPKGPQGKNKLTFSDQYNTDTSRALYQ